MNELPKLGVGMGFREPYRSDIFLNRPKIDFLEITADHYLDASERKLEELELLCENFTLIPHSLDLSLGSAEGVDDDYLDRLAILIEKVNPPWFSDHICFTRSAGIKIGHLAPVPFTNEALDVFGRNIETVKSRIGIPLVLENITYNVAFPSSQMSEAEFISKVANDNDCGLLIDAANLFINSCNLGYDWREFLNNLPLGRVVQIHFVGAHRSSDRLIDAHADATGKEIWNVFKEICVRCNIKGAILERDANLPPFADILAELETARRIMEDQCSVPAAEPIMRPTKGIAGLAV